MRPSLILRVAIVGAAILTGCNAILGLQVGDLAGAGGASATGTGGTAGVTTTSSSSTASSSTSSSSSASSSSSSSASGAGGGGSSSSSGTIFDVPCGNGSEQCVGPAELCCFSKIAAACDVCSTGGQCPAPCQGAGFNMLVCNDETDCGAGQVCCGMFSGTSIAYTTCEAGCGPGELLLCTASSQCSGLSCFGSGYAGYKYCQ